VREIEWTGTALDDMAMPDKSIARRVKQTVERFADTGAGNVKRLHGIDPPSIASAWAITGCASTWKTRLPRFSAYAIGGKLTAERRRSSFGALDFFQRNGEIDFTASRPTRRSISAIALGNWLGELMKNVFPSSLATAGESCRGRLAREAAAEPRRRRGIRPGGADRPPARPRPDTQAEAKEAAGPNCNAKNRGLAPRGISRHLRALLSGMRTEGPGSTKDHQIGATDRREAVR